MKLAGFFYVMFTISAALAQTPTFTAVPDTSGGFMFIGQTAMPKNTHDFAVERINAYHDYKLSKGIPITVDYMFTINGANQSFAVDKDGHVSLREISLEDAFLLLYSMQTDNLMDKEKRWDAEEEAREKARADKPPDKLKVGTRDWDVHSLPAWSRDTTLMADTNCDLRRVRVLETSRDKQDSMLHEILHIATGCNHSLELHRTIYAITPRLLKLLQANPDVVDYLTKRGNGDDGPNEAAKGYLRAMFETEESSPCAKLNWPDTEECRGEALAIAYVAHGAATENHLGPIQEWPQAPAATVWPTIVSAHIVLNSVQATQQGHPVPVCTEKSTTTCYDPSLRNITGRLYSEKSNCERMEGVDCTRNQERWAPIGLPIFEETKQ